MKCEKHSNEQAIALFKRAIDLCENRQYDEAILILLHLSEFHIDSIEEWNILEFLGAGYYNTNNDAKAIHYLERGYSNIIDEDNEEHHKLTFLLFLGSAYTNRGESVKAIEYFKEANKFIEFYYNANRYNDLYNFYKDRGYCYLRAHNFDDALSEFEMAMEMATNNIPKEDREDKLNMINYLIGETYYTMGEWGKSYKSMIRVDFRMLKSPDDDYYKEIFFQLLVYMEYYDQALQEFKKLKVNKMRDVDKASVYFWLAKALYHNRLYAESRDALAKAMRYPCDREWLERDRQELAEELDKIG